MKIAICINQCSVGGVGTSTYIMANGMRRAGQQADIIVTDGQSGPDYERARRDGWPVEAICDGEHWLWRRLLITQERLSKYDVVINNHSTETKLVLPALPTRTIRLSVIRSTNDSVILDGKLQSPYLNALVAISPEVQRLLDEAGTECRTVLIANAIKVKPGVTPSLGERLKLAYLGRLTDIDKNILLIPKIALACKELGIHFVLDVAGDGYDRHRLEAKIKDYELSNCIRLIGAIPFDDVGNFFSKRQFGFFPSNYEGFGLSLAEAMAVGCVPIASDIASYRWILGEDANTLVCPVKNARAYAERIFTLSAEPERYLQVQKRLQRRQQEHFSPEVTVNGYLQLIDELQNTHDECRFAHVSLGNIPLSAYHRRRCSRFWWLLQKIKYGLQ